MFQFHYIFADVEKKNAYVVKKHPPACPFPCIASACLQGATHHACRITRINEMLEGKPGNPYYPLRDYKQKAHEQPEAIRMYYDF